MPLSCHTLSNGARRRSTQIVSAVVLLAALVFAGCGSEPAELSTETKDATALLPASSSIVAMVDVQHIRDNAPDGEDMLNRFQNDGPDDLNEALDEMGLDLKEDIRRVYVGGRVRGDDSSPLVLVYGTFNRNNIESYVDRKLSEEDDVDLEKRELRGYTAYQTVSTSESRQGRPSFTAALVSDALMIAGATAEVEAAVSRFDGEDNDALADGPAMDLVRNAVTGKSMWAVATRIPEEMPSSGNERMDRLRRVVRSAAASMTFDGGDLDTRVLLAAEDGADAADIADLTRGLVGLMKRNSDMNEDWKQVLETIDVSDNGDNVEITARVGRSIIELETKKMTNASSSAPATTVSTSNATMAP